MTKVDDKLKQFITAELDKPNSVEFVKEVLEQFVVKGTENVTWLVDTATNIACSQLYKKQKRIENCVFATRLLIDQHVAKPLSEAVKDSAYIATILKVCSVHFPEGLTGSEDKDEKAYYNEMLDILKQKPKGYDYTGGSLWLWAKHSGVTKWLIDVIQSHVDSDFSTC